MALESSYLVGMWDVYSRGVHSELNLMANGQYTHMLWGGVQGYWGNWSLREDPQGPVLHLALAGSQPKVFNGPTGPQPMYWPEFEDWLVTGLQGNVLTTTDSVLMRRVAPGAGLPGIGFSALPPMPPTIPYTGTAPFQPVQAFHPAVGAPQFQPQAAVAPHLQGAAVSAPQQPYAQPPQQPHVQPMPGQPPPPTVASIYAQMLAQDQATTATINAQWQGLHNYQIGLVRDANTHIVAATHAEAQQFIRYAAS